VRDLEEPNFVICGHTGFLCVSFSGSELLKHTAHPFLQPEVCFSVILEGLFKPSRVSSRSVTLRRIVARTGGLGCLWQGPIQVAVTDVHRLEPGSETLQTLPALSPEAVPCLGAGVAVTPAT